MDEYPIIMQIILLLNESWLLPPT